MTGAIPHGGNGRGRLRHAACCAALALLLGARVPAAAVEPGAMAPGTLEPVTVEGGIRDGIGRMTLTFQAPVRVESKTENGRLFLRFDRPCAADLSRLEGLAPIAGPPERSPDGMSLSLPLQPDVTAFSVSIDRTVHLQLLPRALLNESRPRNARPWGKQPSPALDPTSRPSRRSGPEPRPAAGVRESRPAAVAATGSPDLPPSTPPIGPPAAPPATARQQDAGAPIAGAEPTALQPTAPPAVPAAAAPAAAPAPAVDVSAGPPTLRFGWPQPVAAAIFKRGAAVWVVFDRPLRLDLARLRAMAGAAVTSIEQPPHDKATLLRLGLARPLQPQVQRDGSAWLIQLVDTPVQDAEPIVPEARDSGTAQARLALPVAEPSPPVRFTDTGAGDELIAVPVVPLGRSVRVTYTYPQLSLLPSAQGIVIQPLSDELRVRSAHDGVEITLPQGLAISPPGADASTRSLLRVVEKPSRLLAATGWDDATMPFSAVQEARMKAIASAEGPAREAAERALAQVYLGHGMAAEALGMINALQRTAGKTAALPQQQAELQADLRLIRGIANVLMARPDEARADLADPELAATDEGALWRMLADAARGHPLTEPDALDAWITIADGYPRPLREAALLPLLDAAVTAGRTAIAGRLITALRGLPAAEALSGWLDCQEGRLKLAAGDLDAAAALWQRAAASASEPARARAIFERSVALLDAGRISRDAAIADLNGLRTTWRGDDLEFRTLTTLARLYADQQDVASALRVWRDALSRFPGHPESGAIADAMTGLFERAFRDGLVERLPPWQAVALFHEFNELSPAGPRGDALLLAYARRLAAAELPGRAAAVIETLLQGQRTQAQRAEIGLELARFFIRDGQPEAALAALRRTQEPAADDGVAQARRLAEAEALRALGRLSESVARLGDDRSAAAQAARLRAARATADWPHVIGALQGLSALAKGGDRQALLVDRAAALTLAGDDVALVRLRQEQAETPAASADAQLFALLTAPSVPLRADTTAVKELVNDAKRLAAAAATP